MEGEGEMEIEGKEETGDAMRREGDREGEMIQEVI